MATITLEVPDELADDIALQRDHLPKLLQQALVFAMNETPPNDRYSNVTPVYREIIDFLTAEPTLEQMAEFKISAPTQERLEELLEKNREGELTVPEQTELDQYARYRHILILLKACARHAVASRPE